MSTNSLLKNEIVTAFGDKVYDKNSPFYILKKLLKKNIANDVKEEMELDLIG